MWRHLRRGFSLIELLVAISIIAVLIALLFPVLGAVRKQAVQMRCLTALRTAGQASTLYANDHRELYATFDYPLDSAGLPEPFVAPDWGRGGGGGWLVGPFNEVTFWGYHLRTYVTDNSASPMSVAESLACPVVFRQWSRSLDPLPGNAVQDPMRPMQTSFFQSLAMVTRSSAWQATEPPVVEAEFGPNRHSDVVFPSSKSWLVEASSFHGDDENLLGSSPMSPHNVIASDGHVRAIRTERTFAPSGFITLGTGAEGVGFRTDQWASSGIPLVSTSSGIRGRDW